MLRFTSIQQHYPETRPASERVKDFNEIYLPFDPKHAAVQASRCSQCGIPYCQIHCPLQNNIPDWLKLAAEGRLEEAYAISSATNTFPEICGRICPQDKLCEGNCVIEPGFGAVTIGTIEKYITEQAFEHGLVKPAAPKNELSQSVGIIGAGPAGLSAADMLRCKGYQVHVYDRYDRVGGLLIYGIPNFKLDKSVVTRRERLLRESGVQFHLNIDIGKNISLAELREKHDALLIATGVYKAKELDMPNTGIAAMDFLTASNKANFGEKNPLEAVGKHVVVIGGGDTAMDCVRTAVRQQAASVICLYRRDRENMPGSAKEVKHAEQEGVRFEWLSAPAGFSASGISVKRMRLTAPDGSGRRSVVASDEKPYPLKADMVIKALGFDAEDLPGLFTEPSLQTGASGTLTIDPKHYLTSLSGVFAAGDIVRGASLVVWAIKDGREAAEAMHTYLQIKKEAA